MTSPPAPVHRRPTRLAVSLITATPPLSEQIASARRGGAEIAELRVDRLGVEPAQCLLAAPQPVEIVLTIRQRDEGGRWDGPLDEKLALFESLGRAHVDYVDIELALWRESPTLRERVGRLCGLRGAAPTPGARPRLILSMHRPDADLITNAALLRELWESPAHVAKAVFSAADAADALRVVAWAQRRADARPAIVLAMGQHGLVSRVLARKWGALLSFATLTPATASAPGQPTLETLTGLYRWKTLDAATRVYGVVGWPVAHSRGPALHNAAMDHDGINGVYLPMAVQPGYAGFERFMAVLDGHPELDVDGLSVTIPHKANALRWLDKHRRKVSTVARSCGAVNTLTRRDGRWLGDNTDVPAVLEALRAAGVGADELRGMSADVLGAGGVARAVLAALRQTGCRATIYARNAQRAAALADAMGCEVAAWQDRSRANGALLVNCTPVGMEPEADACPMPAKALRRYTIVFDTVYTPPETRLLALARRHGARTVSGEAMFLTQARLQYAHWHGRPMPTLHT